jgi:xanthine phosphoribosyltransferase
MQELKERIVKEGKVLPGNIIKVDGFLNHRIDTGLMTRIADEFGRHFNMDDVTMILTAEASGIALAAIVAQHFQKPMIFAKKAKSDNIEGGLYQSDIFSYTYKKKVTLLVSKEWLSSTDRVLIVDDFMANGEAVRVCARSWRPPAPLWWASAAPWKRAFRAAATACGPPA